MIASIIYEGVEIKLPYIPIFEVSQEYNDIEYKNINGDIYTIPYKPIPRKIEFTGFISNKKIQGYNTLAPTKINDLLNLITRSRKDNKPLKFIVANNEFTVISFNCIGTLSYGTFDGIGDIPYKLVLKEYKVVGD